jgi:Mn2+/Fe2+ NRAMP family transporter
LLAQPPTPSARRKAGNAGWKTSLGEAVGFYGVICVSVLLGLGIGFSQIDPIQALFWSAVINGFVAVPIMAGMMMVATRRNQMGRFPVSTPVRIFGWAATLVMAVAAAAMLIF